MVLVIAEQRDGVLNKTSWEAIVAAQQVGQLSPIPPREVGLVGHLCDQEGGDDRAVPPGEVAGGPKQVLEDFGEELPTVVVVLCHPER